MIKPLFIGLFTTLTLSACSSFSGLDAKGSFSCKAPDGILCESMSGIYATAMQNNLPGQQVNQKPKTPLAQTPPSRFTAALYSGMPLRTAPQILRLWFAPWEDRDGDLHDQAYVYLVTHPGQWAIAHHQQQVHSAYRPIENKPELPSQITPVAIVSQSPAPDLAGSSEREEPEVSIGIHQGHDQHAVTTPLPDLHLTE